MPHFLVSKMKSKTFVLLGLVFITASGCAVGPREQAALTSCDRELGITRPIDRFSVAYDDCYYKALGYSSGPQADPTLRCYLISDYEAKKDMLDNIIKLWDVVHAVDDNPNVIRPWEDHGIPTTKIGTWDGNKA